MKDWWHKLSLFLISALYNGERSVSRPGRFTTGDREPRYPLHRMLGQTKSRSKRSGEQINVVTLPVIERRFLGSVARNLVAIPTELFRLKSEASTVSLNTIHIDLLLQTAVIRRAANGTA
jgi:hypothetical protein